MQTENHIIVLQQEMPQEDGFNYLTTRDEEPLLTRLFKVIRALSSQTEKESRRPGHSDFEQRLEIESDIYADLAFLKQNVVAPFPVRLARELRETIKTVW